MRRPSAKGQRGESPALRPREARPGWCPQCGARLPARQVGRSHGRTVAYCVLCETYWIVSTSAVRRASSVERRLAREDLFESRGLAEPVDTGP